MEALKTGTVALKIPFLCNYEKRLEQPVPFDFIGLQYYTDPLLKISLSGGDSVTRVSGEKVCAYRYRTYPQGLASAIEEMSAFDKPIDLTEIGMDTGINKGDDDHERIAYFNKIFQVVQRALDARMPVRSMMLWTLIDNFDWHQGWTLPEHCPIRFGLYRFDYKTGQITPRGVVHWLKNKLTSNH
jgi:beta-glucosidase